MNKKTLVSIGIIIVLSISLLVFYNPINNFLLFNFHFAYTSTVPFFIIIFCLFILLALRSDNDRKMLIKKSIILFIFFFVTYFLVRSINYFDFTSGPELFWIGCANIASLLISIMLIIIIFKNITRKDESAKNSLIIPAIFTLFIFQFTGVFFANSIDFEWSEKNFLDYYVEKAIEKNDITMCEDFANLPYFGEARYPYSCIDRFAEKNQDGMMADYCMKLSDKYAKQRCWVSLSKKEDKLFKDGFSICQYVTGFTDYNNPNGYSTDDQASALCYRKAARYFKDPEICKEQGKNGKYGNQCIVNLFLKSEPEDLIKYDKEKICNNLEDPEDFYKNIPIKFRDACLNNFEDYRGYPLELDE